MYILELALYLVGAERDAYWKVFIESKLRYMEWGVLSSERFSSVLSDLAAL